MTVAEHGSTPVPVKRTGVTGSAVSSSFSPPSQALVVVLVQWLWSRGPTGDQISVQDSLGNSYSRLLEQDNVGYTSKGFFSYFYNSAPGSITVTATNTCSISASVHIAPRVLTGAASNQSNGARAANTDGYNTILNARSAGSQIYAIGGASSDTVGDVWSGFSNLDIEFESLVRTDTSSTSWGAKSAASFFGSDTTSNNDNQLRTTTTLYQGGETDSGGGYNGTQKSVWALNGNPQSDLAGKTVDSVHVRLANTHSWYNAGLNVILGYIPYDTTGWTWWDASGITHVSTYHQDKGTTLNKDVTGLGLGSALQDGSAKSMVLGPGGSYDLNSYGIFDADSPMVTVDWHQDFYRVSAFAKRSSVTTSPGNIVSGWSNGLDTVIAIEIQAIGVYDVSGTCIDSSSTSGAIALRMGPTSGEAYAVSVTFGNIPARLPIAGSALTYSLALGATRQYLPIASNLVARSITWGAKMPVGIFVPPTVGLGESVTALWLGPDLVPHGPIPFYSLTAQLYYNQVGSWSMVVPYSDAMWSMARSGEFIVHVNWKGLFEFGGKCEQPGYDDSIPGSRASTSTAGATITLSGANYLALIANRIAYPAPGSVWSAQTAASADTQTNVKLETAIKHYVSYNAGPSALAARKVALLDISTDLARGGTVSYSAKFGDGIVLYLMDIIRKLVAIGGPMGVQISRDAAARRLTFDVYVPRDLSKRAWFSKDLGNLTSVGLRVTDPTVTNALVRGSASFTESTVASSQWSRIESFVDQSQEADATALSNAGTDAISSGKAGAALSVTTTDTPYLTFGRDYGLGDIVTVEISPGDTYTDIVSGVALNVDPAQDPQISVVPTIGYSSDAMSADQSVTSQLLARVADLERRLNAQRG